MIMATALDAGRDEVRALELGANDYVTKPIRVEALVEALNQVAPRQSLGEPGR